jgi:hypothetical protein
LFFSENWTFFFPKILEKEQKNLYDQKLKRKSCSQFFLFLVNFRILATTQKEEKKKRRRKVVVPNIKPFLKVKIAHSCHMMRKKKDLKVHHI